MRRFVRSYRAYSSPNQQCNEWNIRHFSVVFFPRSRANVVYRHQKAWKRQQKSSTKTIFSHVYVNIRHFDFACSNNAHLTCGQIRFLWIRYIIHGSLLSVVFLSTATGLRQGHKNMQTPESIIMNPDVRKESRYVSVRSRNKPKNKFISSLKMFALSRDASSLTL